MEWGKGAGERMKNEEFCVFCALLWFPLSLRIFAIFARGCSITITIMIKITIGRLFLRRWSVGDGVFGRDQWKSGSAILPGPTNCPGFPATL